jgi:SPP1 gp7 family putative phage head morphogenesis protein
MECILEKYNNHKRRTLDRITSIYSRRGMEIIKKVYLDAAEDIFNALEDEGKYKPDLSSFDKKFEDLLESHFQTVIDVGVSDGYREVTPENKLSTWLDYDPLVPIERTLPVELTNYKKKLSDRIEKLLGDKRPKAFLEVIGFTKDQTLDYLKNTYKHLAKDWLAGEGTIRDVKEALQRSLGKVDSSVERTFRTETTRWFNESRAEYFESQTSASHVQIFAVTDGRTSHICESRNGFVVPIDEAREKKYLPPFHPNCRTVQRALFENLPSHKRLIENGMAMNEANFESLPHGLA